VAILGAALILGAVACLAYLHARDRELDPLRDAVSDYGTTPLHRFYRAQVVLMGLGAASIAVALARDTGVGATVIWLWAFAASRVAIAFFMTDRPGAPVTRDGRIHLVLAAIAFASIGFGAPNIGSDLAAEPGWSELAHQLGWVVAVTAIATLVARRLAPRWFGLIERSLYVAYIAWLLIVAFTLAT
jgi:hypothetical protein